MNNMITTPRIYVACLASYNAGILHGCWVELNDGADAVFDYVKAMLEKSKIANAEEWAIHDYEGFERVCELFFYLPEQNDAIRRV